MDSSKCREILLANIERLRADLRLWDWRIDIFTGRLEGNAVGEVRVHSPYQRAEITVDNDKVDDEAEALRVLRHELIHIFCWPMHAFADSTGDMDEERHKNWTFYIERMVWSVEQMMDRHEIPIQAVSSTQEEVNVQPRRRSKKRSDKNLPTDSGSDS